MKVLLILLEKNIQRLDDFVVKKDNKNFKIIESNMLDKNNYNSSDHIPIKLEIELI